ncbi:MAG: hypothetical protein ACREPR_06705, partial [Brasilonema sp.]
MPYSPEAAEFGRPNLGIPSGDSLIGETLAGDVVSWETPLALEPEATSIDIPSNLAEDVVLQKGSGKSFPTIWLAGGGLGLLLLLLTLGGGGDSSSGRGSGTVTSTPSVGTPPSSGGSVPPSGGGSPGDNQITEVPPTPPVSSPPGQEVKKVPEPTTVSALVLLIIVLWVLGYGHQRTHTGKLMEFARAS